jgi:4a-hydroxytetrahydrobiopterin dehydratase
MTDFVAMKCVACRVGAPPATEEELDSFLEDHPEWQRTDVDGVPQLRRVFAFDDFVTALDFTIRVGRLAEEEDHHPAILIEWGRVEVRWWTHKIKSLHRNDLIMGAKTDRLYGEASE